MKAYMQAPDGTIIQTADPSLWSDSWTRLPNKKGAEAFRAYHIARLRETIKPEDKIYCLLRHRSRSGMVCDIAVKHTGPDGLSDITFNTSAALGWSMQNNGVRVNGCGMDMGFHLVYTLSRVLFPKGFGCIGEKCPSNDHSNGDRDYTKHQDAKNLQALKNRKPGQISEPDAEPGHWHNDGGYALRHSWL